MKARFILILALFFLFNLLNCTANDQQQKAMQPAVQNQPDALSDKPTETGRQIVQTTPAEKIKGSAVKQWFPPDWPHNTHLAHVDLQRMKELKGKIATHYKMEHVRWRGAGPAAGFVYLSGKIDGQPYCWANGQLYDRQTFFKRYQRVLRSK